jgi:hypothetical protein
MVDAKPTTPWAVVSLACGILGWVGVLALLALLDYYSQVARATAGVGVVAGLGHALLSAVYCFFGVIFGVTALLRIRLGRYAGRGMAWTGIVLGGLPLALAALWFCIAGGESSLF